MLVIWHRVVIIFMYILFFVFISCYNLVTTEYLTNLFLKAAQSMLKTWE